MGNKLRWILEGRFDWSDFHPWYYLPKYMAITIPFIVFVILKKSNLYGSWRHFLFVYPGIILISALGIHAFFVRFKHRIIRIAAIVLLLVLSAHPLRFMAANHPYYYLYYNQFTGGLKGAYGNYETDYYYHTMREGAEWLQEYLKNKPTGSEIIVGGNFPIKWYFRKEKTVKFIYFPYQRRSEYNWDYAVIANSYISPYQLKNKNWPPVNTIHTIFADGIPVCAIIERVSKDDLLGIQELEKGHNIKSALLFQNALDYDPLNELIYSKFAKSLIGVGQIEQAEQILHKCLKINPEYEPALILSGDLALKQNDTGKAAGFYEKVIQANRKYFSVYPKLAGIYEETDVKKARKVLRECLKLNPRYIPALVTLAETYRETAPEIAAKYDEQINKLKQ